MAPKPVCDVYKTLHELKIPDPEMDVGFPVVDYVNNQKDREGIGDGIQCEEAVEYAFEKGLVEKEPKVRASIEKMLGYSLPWEFKTPASTDDAVEWSELTTKIETAMARLKSDIQKLQATGKLKERGEYEEAMAAAIYLFAYAPASKDGMELVENNLKDEIFGLEKFGLSNFWGHIKEQGGLGLVFMHEKQKGEPEMDVLQTLLKNKGNCTEKSKILYALFKQSGLSPFFVDVELSEIEPQYRSFAQGHVCIGLQVKDKVRLFDLAQRNSNAPYKSFHRITLRHYLMYDLSNKAWALLEKNKTREAAEIYQQALKFGKDSTAYFVYLGQGELFIRAEQYKEAQEVLDKALSIHPRQPETFYSLGYALIRLHQVDKGLDYLFMSLQVDLNNQKQLSDVSEHLNELAANFQGGQKVRLAIRRFKGRLEKQLGKGPQLKDQAKVALVYLLGVLKPSLKLEVTKIIRELGIKVPKVKSVDKKK